MVEKKKREGKKGMKTGEREDEIGKIVLFG